MTHPINESDVAVTRRRRRATGILGGMLTLVIVAAPIVWAAHGFWMYRRNSKQKQQEAKTAETQNFLALQRAISSMAVSQSAIVDWQKELCKNYLAFVSPLYSRDIQSAVMRRDGRPSLWFVKVNDIEGQSQPYTVQLQSYVCGIGDTEVHLKLVADDRIVGEIEQSSDGDETYLAILAQISEVDKTPMPEVVVSTDEEGQNHQHEDVTVRDIFQVTGRCVEITALGDTFGLSAYENSRLSPP